jgi:hypothetical protein
MYKQRGDAENGIKEFKYDFGWKHLKSKINHTYLSKIN